MERDTLTSLLDAFQKVPHSTTPHPTFMEIARYPHYENVCSNILAFFLQPDAPHGLAYLLVESLLALTDVEEHQANITVEREVPTHTGNRIDLVIESDTHVIAIENKIFHSVNNPFHDYQDYIETCNPGQKNIVKLLLSLNVTPEHTLCGFHPITYADLFFQVRTRIGDYLTDAENKYVIFLLDFMKTIEHLTQEPSMNRAFLTLLQERQGDVLDLITEVEKFRAELRSKVKELGQLIEVKNQSFPIKQVCWRESQQLADYLVHEIKVSGDFTIAIDAVISINGWTIKILTRQNKNKFRLKEILTQLGISYDEEVGDEKGRSITGTFDYAEKPENIQPHVQNLIDQITQHASLLLS